jgi:H+/Cl- antiporter ClcA
VAAIAASALETLWRPGVARRMVADAPDVRSCTENVMLVGAGTGIAVAFRAPIAGVMFVLEEAISFFSGHIIFPIYVAGVVGYFFLMLLKSPKLIPPAEKFSEFDLCESNCFIIFEYSNKLISIFELNCSFTINWIY